MTILIWISTFQMLSVHNVRKSSIETESKAAKCPIAVGHVFFFWRLNHLCNLVLSKCSLEKIDCTTSYWYSNMHSSLMDSFKLVSFIVILSHCFIRLCHHRSHMFIKFLCPSVMWLLLFHSYCFQGFCKEKSVISMFYSVCSLHRWNM